MRAPAGLGSRGTALWRSIVKGLPDGWELDEREREVLALAARQADDGEALELAVKHEGATVAGSAGQPRLNAAVVELRQGRLAIGRLLGQLALPDEHAEPRTAAGRRGQRAARSRWEREQAKRVRRGAA